MVDEAVGSGVGNDQGALDDDGGGAVNVASAGVFAREEGCMDGNVGRAFPTFSGGYRLRPRMDVAFSPFNVSQCLNSPEFRSILYDAPPAIPRDVSPISNTRCFRVVDEGKGGNRGRSAALSNGAPSAPSSKKIDAGAAKEELAVRSSMVRSSVMSGPVSYRVIPVHGPPVEIRLVGCQWVSPDPISHEWSAWCTPNVHRPLVVSRSPSVEVCPPSVGRALENVSVDGHDRLLRPLI